MAKAGVVGVRQEDIAKIKKQVAIKMSTSTKNEVAILRRNWQITCYEFIDDLRCEITRPTQLETLET